MWGTGCDGATWWAPSLPSTLCDGVEVVNDCCTEAMLDMALSVLFAVCEPINVANIAPPVAFDNRAILDLIEESPVADTGSITGLSTDSISGGGGCTAELAAENESSGRSETVSMLNASTSMMRADRGGTCRCRLPFSPNPKCHEVINKRWHPTLAPSSPLVNAVNIRSEEPSRRTLDSSSKTRVPLRNGWARSANQIWR